MKPTTRPQTWQCSPESEWVIDQHPLRLYQPFEAPRAAPVIFLLHGLEENWDIWLSVCQLLSDRFRLFCLELPWNGQNGHRWGRQRSAAEWLRQALALAPTPPAVLVGHSLAANALLEYLQHYEVPGLQGLVLVSPFYYPRYEEFDWSFFDRSREIFREIMQEGLVVRQGAKQVEASLLSAMVDKVYEFVGPFGFIEFLSLFMWTPALQLNRIQVPALVIGGTRDAGSTPAGNAALARVLPRGRLELLTECGHFCMLTHPRVVGGMLSRFVSECLGKGNGNTSENEDRSTEEHI